MAAHRKRIVIGGSARSISIRGCRSPWFEPSASLKALPKCLSLLAGLALFAWTVGAPLPSNSAWAQGFSRVLEEVRLFGKGESIQIVFSQPFEGIPNEEYGPGRFALTFTGVGSKKPVRDLRAREEILFREIKIVQNQYSTTVTFLLRDPSLNLKGRVTYTRDKNLLNVEVHPAGTPAVASQPVDRPAAEALLSELEQKIAGAPVQKAPAAAPAVAQPSAPAKPAMPVQAPPAGPAAPGATSPPATGLATQPKAAPTAPLGLGGMPESDFFGTLATMVVALAIMLGGLYGILYLYKRYLHGRLARFAGTPAIRQVASFSIGPRQRIVILEINGEWIACGVTPSQITFLTRLTGEHPVTREESPTEAVNPASESPEAARSGALVKPDPVHQFAEVLKQKVRSLKRIN